MKTAFNSAINSVFVGGVSALAIGVAVHQYDTSYEELCKGIVESNTVSNFIETATGSNLSGAGQWHSATGAATCNFVGAVERPVVKVADRAFIFMGG